jgi:putative aldouronate transport system permease protein
MKTNAVQQTFFHAVMVVLAAACVFPFLLLFIVSFTDENSIVANGYSLFPDKFSLDAYRYLWTQATPLARAYGITVFITVIGTVTGLLISSTLAYSLSRDELPFRRVLSFLVVFTLLFNGGLVPTYLVYTQIFHLKNTLLALIVPGLLTNAFFILIIRAFFKMSIPLAVIESAYIDGASEWTIFWRIVMPLSLPILATIGLMLTIAYWNDWFNGLIYITDPKLYSIQNLLNRMLSNIQFLMQNDLGGRGAETIANLPMNAVRMAIAAIGILPILIIYPFFQQYLVKGLVIGAVKG